ncbi:methylated-DNA--[protein]-cysteine S-methyltransferase [Romboutsia sp.]|uniref:methylated-DNA--[protein]-cysteine S-methyltransferase n=1 Tax=Romboutsia sp. TaxID=1965302 RepID=UPI002B99E190|nr:methylated-DNA--[protein]-cysteine S-methyltransferase [Romboutsia sp.]HSQ87865.1 methylated-DNA--[protein]-cysteine S-methyltransferase [Romboutsia sp.]
MKNIGYDRYESIIGKLYIVVSDKGVERVLIDEEEFNKYIEKNNIKEDKEICKETVKQLDEYFNKKRKHFNLPINIETTEFRKSVYNELLKIPYGQTRSYSDIAKAINNEKAVRAVGQANRLNNIVIIIPCHRVIGKNGKMVGYAGDKISIKEILLKLEGIF